MRRVLAPAAALLLVASAAACGSHSKAAAPTTATGAGVTAAPSVPPAPTTTVPATTPADAPTTAGPAAAVPTTAGCASGAASGGTGTVAFGQPQILTLSGSRIQLTVNPPVKGSLSDFGGANLGEATQGKTPWYVTVIVANSGPLPLCDANLPGSLSALTASGAATESLAIQGLAACPNGAQQLGNLTAGQHAVACQVEFVPTGQSVAAVSFGGATWRST